MKMKSSPSLWLILVTVYVSTNVTSDNLNKNNKYKTPNISAVLDKDSDKNN